METTILDSIYKIPQHLWISALIPLVVFTTKMVANKINRSHADTKFLHLWKSSNKSNYEALEKLSNFKESKISQEISIKSIEYSLLLETARNIYRTSEREKPATDMILMLTFGLLGAISGALIKLNVLFCIPFIILTLLVVLFEIFWLETINRNKQYLKFLKLSLLSPEKSQALFEIPELVYKVFSEEIKDRVGIKRFFGIDVPAKEYRDILTEVEKMRNRVLGLPEQPLCSQIGQAGSVENLSS